MNNPVKFSTVFMMMIICLQLYATGPEDMIYMTEDYPPSNYLENGELKGVAVEVLKAIWKKMGVTEQKIIVYPWARGYALVQTQPDHMLFAMTRSVERDSLFKWVGPIYRGRFSLFSLNNNRIVISKELDILKYRVGVIQNDFAENAMIKAGVTDKNLVKVAAITQLVKMLRSSRIDLICIYEDTLTEYALNSGSSRDEFYRTFTVKENQMYFAFNKNTDDALVQRFQKALNDIEAERKAIVLKYNSIP